MPPWRMTFAAARPRLTRTVGMLQIVGSLLAIPVGLASAYSIYRVNFSVETTCQSLRANIISMLDKSVDAGTRRMLVRRDVETFEQTCGSVDPDATAAFKSLLATEKPAVTAVPAAPARVTAPVAEPPAKQAVRKADAHPQTAAKMPAAAWPSADRREPDGSDTQWLDAVRQALVTHEASRAAGRSPRRARRGAGAAARCTRVGCAGSGANTDACGDARRCTGCRSGGTRAAAARRRRSASRARGPAPGRWRSSGAAGAIPDAAEAANADANDHRPRVRRWIAKIPLVGNVIDNGLE